ncbi:hypothetical protein, partial [Clostridium perfringens]|uniref:hypothetical protein n=1 Tax=Clostridium perfringens TaxID=1502 RepID=UPI0037542955
IAVASLFTPSGEGYKCAANYVTFQIPAANCKCKTNSAKSVMKGIPGIFDVIVGPGEKPISTILFDPKKTSRDAIFENPKLKNFKEKFEVFEV